MFKATVNQRQIIGMRAQSAKISKNYKCLILQQWWNYVNIEKWST